MTLFSSIINDVILRSSNIYYGVLYTVCESVMLLLLRWFFLGTEKPEDSALISPDTTVQPNASSGTSTGLS